MLDTLVPGLDHLESASAEPMDPPSEGAQDLFACHGGVIALPKYLQVQCFELCCRRLTCFCCFLSHKWMRVRADVPHSERLLVWLRHFNFVFCSIPEDDPRVVIGMVRELPAAWQRAFAVDTSLKS